MGTTMPSEEPEVLFERRGTAGIVTLNRPAALNAVTSGMVRLLHEQLAAWRDDPAVTRVLVTAAGDRAFSAGGDLRGIYEAARAGRQQDSLAFWRDEYRLNFAIKHYPKPYVALIDGIVMGGGAGVSVHGSHRVAGDRFLFAMPEVGIGFFPDVGATWFLPRFPGELGAYCALTGERLKPADGIATGVATHHVASARFGDLIAALTGAAPVDALLGAFAEPAGQGAGQGKGDIAARGAAIERLFAGRSRRGYTCAARYGGVVRRRRCGVGRRGRRDDPQQGAAQPQARAGAGAARPRLVVCGLHARGMAHRIAGRLWRGLL